ncbi:MAG: hypothetical protein JO306_12250 [Gemmatimonadetes bacterium]|nr:hypothetical protein [Gemmatimonadota bacterium]
MSAISFAFPGTPEGMLLWSQLLLLWNAVHYGTAREPVTWPKPQITAGRRAGRMLEIVRATHGWGVGRTARIALLMTGAWVLIGTGGRRTMLLTCYLSLALLLPTFRGLFASMEAAAEWEILVNLAAVAASTSAIAAGPELTVAHGFIDVAVNPARISVVLSGFAILIFLGRGCTFVVRGMLEKAGTLPAFKEPEKARIPELPVELRYDASRDVWVLASPPPPATPPSVEGNVDSNEINRGRLIGNLERVLLALLAMVGSYPAIAFVMTAKGLVRAKEFEKRDYAEYFLIGTLVSASLALVLGTFLRMLAERFWSSPGP